MNILTFFAHLNQANILCEEQHGLRERRCCESQLIVKIDDFAQCLAKRLIHTIFLDFTKAFDKVPHKKLCHKLASYSITGPVLQWISDFYLTGGGQISDSAVVLSGVPQGTVLRPLLFLCYINNLPRSIKSTVRMHADALLCTMLLIVLMTVPSFKMIYFYWKSGQMQFNSSKCSTNKKLTPSFTYHINDVPIKAVQHAKYLGTTIDSKLTLTWKEHIKITTHKTNTALAFLRCNLKPCSLYIKSKCYLGTVRPISLSMFAQCGLSTLFKIYSYISTKLK